MFGEAGDEEVLGVRVGRAATDVGAEAEVKDSIGYAAGSVDGAFERDGDARCGIWVARTEARGIDRGAGGDAESSRELKGDTAFEFGGTQDCILGASFEGDEGATVQMATVRDEVEIRGGAPGSDTPVKPRAFICGFPRGADGGVRTGHETDVLFFRVANGISDEAEEVSLPKVGPAIDGEQIQRGGAEAVRGDGAEHTRAAFVPAVESFVAIAFALAGPIEAGRGATETVENSAIAVGGGCFLEKAAEEVIASGGRNFQVDAWRWKGKRGLVSLVDCDGREGNRDKSEEGNDESQRQQTFHKTAVLTIFSFYAAKLDRDN